MKKERKWKWSLSRVRLFATPWTVAYQAPLSMELSPRILEWIAISFSRGSPWLRIKPMSPESPALQADSLPAEPQGKPKKTGVGSLSLLQQIFPTQELNQGLPALQADSLPAELPQSPCDILDGHYSK